MSRYPDRVQDVMLMRGELRMPTCDVMPTFVCETHPSPVRVEDLDHVDIDHSAPIR